MGWSPDGITMYLADRGTGEVYAFDIDPDDGTPARYAPDRALPETVPVPADRPTSCTFGGRDGATPFVTTSRDGFDEATLAASRRPGTCCGWRPGRQRVALYPYRGTVIAR